MNCPYCGGPMEHGEITGDGRGKVRWVPEGELPTKLDRFFADPYRRRLTGATYKMFCFWIQSDYCPKCRKMIFDTDIET